MDGELGMEQSGEIGCIKEETLDQEVSESKIKKKSGVKLLHINCGPDCDCKAAKQRRKRATNVAEADKDYTTETMKKISFDHLDSGNNGGVYNERYGLVLQDEGSQCEFFYPTVNRKESGVIAGIKQFAGKRLKEVEEFYSDNAK